MKNFFHDISWAQIAAGALAAMTSFWLAAKIGVAGSIIGVAIGSIVSAVASQIYKNLLEASGQKFQETVIGSDDEKKNGKDATDEKAHRSRVVSAGTDQTSVAEPVGGSKGAPTPGEETLKLPPAQTGNEETSTMSSEKTETSGSASLGRTISSVKNGGSGKRGKSILGDAHQKSSPTPLSAQQVKRRKRNIIIVSVVSSLVAVILSALAINYLTQGQGTDHVVRSVVSPSTTEETTKNTLPETTRSRGDQGDSNQTAGNSQPNQNQNQTPQQGGKDNQSTSSSSPTAATPTPGDSNQAGTPTNDQTASPSNGTTPTKAAQDLN